MMSRLSLITALTCLFLCQRSCLAASTPATTSLSSNGTTTVSSSNSTDSSSMTASSPNSSDSTTTANTSTATPMTTTQATTTTTQPPFDVQHNTDQALYALKLTVGTILSSDIKYYNASFSRADLLNMLKAYFNFSVGVALEANNTSSQASGIYVLKIDLMIKNPNSTADLRNNVTQALDSIDRSAEFDKSSSADEVVRKFFMEITNICYAENVCPLGFTCNTEGCLHMCRTRDCSNHGMCYTAIDSRAMVITLCQCDSEYETEYSGDNCQHSQRGKLQIIAIIAGVLGAACLVFIIIIIVMCCLYCRKKSASNYNISGASYPNNAYDNSREK